jgi:hypothetical protein
MAIMVKDGNIQQHKTSLQYGLELIDPTISKHVAEFGVWKGDTIRLIRDTLDSSWSVFGFDCFTGLPEDWVDTFIKKGSWDMGGKGIGVYGTIEYIGLFKDTIPKFIVDHPEPLALIHNDSDIYSSSIDILFGLNKQIVKGTVIVFDDWSFMKSTDQQKALKLWCAECDRVVDMKVFDDRTYRPEFNETRKVVVVTR